MDSVRSLPLVISAHLQICLQLHFTRDRLVVWENFTFYCTHYCWSQWDADMGYSHVWEIHSRTCFSFLGIWELVLWLLGILGIQEWSNQKCDISSLKLHTQHMLPWPVAVALRWRGYIMLDSFICYTVPQCKDDSHLFSVTTTFVAIYVPFVQKYVSAAVNYKCFMPQLFIFIPGNLGIEYVRDLQIIGTWGWIP